MNARDTTEEEYHLLPADPDQSGYRRDYEKDGKHNPLERHASKAVIGLCIASFATICLHLGVLGFQGYQLHLSGSKTSEEPLEFRSSYFSLEGIVRDPSAPPPPPIMNSPLIMVQIDSSKPDHVIPYTHRRPTPMGTIYPDDRMLHITSQISTVAQFRILDWGMETCRLKLLLPQSSVPNLKQSFTAQVWRLEASREVDPSRLSWKTRPERAALDTVWEIRSGSTFETNEFHCHSGSVFSVELVCEDPLCDLELLQRFKDPSVGLWLEQQYSA